MRTREEIMKLEGSQRTIVNPRWEHAEMLEVLLDIRDLLQKVVDKQ